MNTKVADQDRSTWNGKGELSHEEMNAKRLNDHMHEYVIRTSTSGAVANPQRPCLPNLHGSNRDTALPNDGI
jgi:hypothetical protein